MGDMETLASETSGSQHGRKIGECYVEGMVQGQIKSEDCVSGEFQLVCLLFLSFNHI
jgi:hypothetical protein